MARRKITRLDVHPEHPEPHKIRQGVALLESGRVVVYPTDTIYGLAAAVDASRGIERLYQLRRLDQKKPLSLVCASLSEASRYTIIHNDCHRYMRRVLPGPYTFILKATAEAPRMGKSRRRTVGVRVPRSPVAQALIETLGRPLISTSALVPGIEADEPSDPVRLSELLDPQVVGLVLDAGLLEGTPSTVIDWSDDDPVVLRHGAGDVSDLDLS